MEGFAIWIYDYEDTYGKWEFGNTNTLSYNSSASYGLKNVNGIMELPFYDTDMSPARRMHHLDGTRSDFYYIDLYHLVSESLHDQYERGESGEAYRLFDCSEPLTYNVSNEGDEPKDIEILMGNPFMANIDLVKFYETNAAVIRPFFSFWNGNQFVTSTVSGGIVTTVNAEETFVGAERYISPSHTFFVTLNKDRLINELAFKVTDCTVTAVVPPSLPSPASSVSPESLKSTPVESDIIRIRATNSEYSAETLVGKRTTADDGYAYSEDAYKIFSQKENVPEVFTVADNYKLAMNFISGAAEQFIPLGLKSDLTGATTFTFTGMSHYSHDKIEFIDFDENQFIDLTGKDRFEYSFTHSVKGLEEGRFVLHIQNSPTGINHPESVDIQVYDTESGIRVLSLLDDPIHQIELYTVGGQLLYDNPAVNSSFYTVTNRWTSEQIVIVRVVTQRAVKNVKLIQK
jgi:hypothetical protein